MRRIAIIGAGQAGLLCAHGLVKAGHQVTLYSDRTADQWLHESRPTGTAGRFDMALQYERELGLAHWEAEAPRIQGIHLTFCPVVGNRLLTLTGRPKAFGLAIDLRLQSHRWMNDLAARGGRVVIEAVTPARLDAIAAEHELTIVATGKADLASMFERDAERSAHAEPQRNLAMVCVKGASMRFEGVPFTAAKFNLFATLGEVFWIPYHHKDVGPSWNLLMEARPGTALDVFAGAKSAEEVLALVKTFTRQYVPWDWEWVRDAEVADKNGWLVGKVTPTVRRPVARLPSGRLVTPLGDTSMVLDPIGGQGANNGNKMARNLVECVVEHGDRPFDEAFLTATFERFYARHGGPIDKFNNLLLETITPPARELLISQYGTNGLGDDGRQRIADAFVENFNDPAGITAAMTDARLAREIISRETGRAWPLAVAAGAFGIARAQIRQKLGRPPGHPVAEGGAAVAAT